MESSGVRGRRGRSPGSASGFVAGARLGLVGSFVVVAACGAYDPGGAADGVVRADSAGVALVTSGGRDVAAPFVLELEWTVGGEGSDLELAEVRPWHVSADAAGRVYVLDAAGRRVLVLGPAGEVEGELGRGGGGPGELSTPIAVHASADGRVGVWDYGQGGVVSWRDGEALPLARVAGGFWGPDVRLVGDRVVFVALEPGDPARERLVLATEDGATPVAELARSPERPAEFPTCGIRGIPVPPLFAPQLSWDMASGRIVASTSSSYEVRVLDAADGRARAVWRRAVPARRATEELALREVGDGLPIPVADCVVPPAEVVRGRGYAEVVPAIRRLALDPAGRVWVLRGGVSDEPALLDVFDDTGAYLGTLPPGAPVPAAFPASDRLVGIETDDDGVMVVSSWRIRRRG